MAGSHVYVVATSDPGTRSALKTASGLARSLATDVVLMVPCRVSFSARPDAHPAALAEAYRQLAASVGVSPIVRVCLGREQYQALASLLRGHAEIVVGGRRRWWFSREERLVRRLIAEGHQVTFADVNGESPAPFVVGEVASV